MLTCQEATKDFSAIGMEIQELKNSLENSTTARNLKEVESLIARAKILKQSLQEKMANFEKKLSPFSELREFLPDIEEQYFVQVENLRSSGLLETLPLSQKEGIIGVDGSEYPLPTPEDIAARFNRLCMFITDSEGVEGEHEIAKKFEQGFTKLLLVPFALPLERLIAAYAQELEKKSAKRELYSYLRNEQGDVERKLIEGLKKEHAIFFSVPFNDALRYYPTYLSDEKIDPGMRKENLIKDVRGDSSGASGGWNIIFAEQNPSIPQLNKGNVVGGRKPFEAGDYPISYLQKIKKNPLYKHEQGLTPEDWVTYALSHLQEHNEILDDWEKSSLCYLLGAYHKTSGQVPSVHFSFRNRQVDFGSERLKSVMEFYGTRTVVSL